MITYTIQTKDIMFDTEKVKLDDMLTRARAAQIPCTYTILEEVDRSVNASRMTYTYYFAQQL